MNDVKTVLLSVVALVSLCAAKAEAGGSMDRSKFQIGAYYLKPPACDEAHVRDIRECGVDFIVGVDVNDRRTLDLFSKYGLGVVADGVFGKLWWGGDGKNAGRMRAMRPLEWHRAQLGKFGAKLDHPAIWMLNLCDEPSALDMPHLGEVCGLLAADAPHTPAYLNLYPNYASVSENSESAAKSQLGTQTYREYVEAYCRSSPLDYISYDFYVYEPNRKRRAGMFRQMYSNFNVIADACRRTGRSLWYIPQVNSHPATNFEATTENRLRFQAHTAMAFGAEVVTWACWMKGWWVNNVLTDKGEKTAQYERLRVVNSELRRLAPLYMQYRNVNTHFVGFNTSDAFCPKGVPICDSLSTGRFIGLKTEEGSPLVVGEMVPRGREDGSRALFVVASGDPYDEAPSMRTLVFDVRPGSHVRAFGATGELPVLVGVGRRRSVRLRENAAVMLTIDGDENALTQPKTVKPSHSTLIAHRGESFDAPENTLPAYRMAVERGFGFECDVYLSADKKVFTFHDANLTRTSGGVYTNACWEVGWNDVLSKLDVGDWGRWKGSRFSGTRPALLEEVLKLAVDGRYIYVEIKSGSDIVPYIKDVFSRQTKATPNNTLFICFNKGPCKTLKKLMPEYKVLWLTDAHLGRRENLRPLTPDIVIETMREIGVDGVDCQFAPDVITADFVRTVRNAGFEFHVWTIDDIDNMLLAFERGVQTVTTNRALYMLEKCSPLETRTCP